MSVLRTPYSVLRTPYSVLRTLTALLFLLILLAGCSGGNGNDSGGNSGGSIVLPSSTYAAGSVEKAQFDRLNQIRLAGGFGVVPQDTLIDQASLNHADYLLAHYYNPLQSPAWSPSMGLVDPATGVLNGHVEVVGLSGFSGILSQARLAYIGRQSESAGEVIAYQEDCVDRLLNTVFHRDGLLNATITGLGIGLRRASNNQDLACVIDYSTSSSMIRPTSWIGLYPMPGQTGVPLGMGGEAPDPAPSVPDAQKGSPVTIYLNTPLASVTSFTLRDAATSAMVPVLLLTKKDFPGYLSDRLAHILPTQLLTTDTTYTASFSGVLVDGTVVTKEWSFSTVASNLKPSVPAPSYVAGSVEKSLFDRLNQVRQAGGFGMVPQDGLLDQSAKNHTAYALANDYDSVAAAWRWATISFDTEVSGTPGFTGVDSSARYVAVGGVASQVSELTGYNKDLMCVDDQLNSVFQRRRALSTDLSGVGFGFSYTANRRDSACFIDYTTSTAMVAPSTLMAVYPMPGQTSLAMSMAADAPDPAPSIPNAQKGLPVSIFLGRTLAQVTSFTLREAATSTVVPVVLVTQKDFPSSLSDREAHIVPTQLLATDATYTASFSGVLVDGTVVTKEWSFSTVVSNLKPSVPAPSYVAGSVEKSLFDRLNQVRQAGGFGMVPQDGLLDQSAKNHAAYALANDYDSGAAAWRWATISFDTEVSGTPGFTGVDSSARYVAVGGGASQVSELTGYNKDLMCVDDQLNSVFQRHQILATDLSGIGIGFSYASNKKDSACFIDYINSSAVIAPSTLMAVYPTPGQTSLAMSMAADAPDPAPSIPNAQKGLPVSIFLGRTLAQVTSFTLRETATSTVVPVVLVTQKDFPDYLSDREAHIVPSQTLSAGTSYTASFSGVMVDGAIVSKDWSFTTQPILPINMALSASVFAGTNSTITVAVSGGYGSMSIWVNSFASYFGGVNPNPIFYSMMYNSPQSITLTRTSTSCTPGLLINCSVDVTVTDSMGNTKMVSIPVN